jgi:hypothetical protein
VSHALQKALWTIEGKMLAWDQAVQEQAFGAPRGLVHTRRNRACASDPRRLWVRCSGGVWVEKLGLTGVTAYALFVHGWGRMVHRLRLRCQMSMKSIRSVEN